MRTMRWISTTAALGLALLTAACGGGDSGGPSGGLAGDWQLVRVNEDGLPENEEYPWGTAGFTDGGLSLCADGCWEMWIEYDKVELGETWVLEDNGGFEVNGNQMLFSSEHYGDEFTAVRNGNSITLTYDFDGDGYYETDFTFTR